MRQIVAQRTEVPLEHIERVGVEAIGAHDVGLANRLREGLGMPPGDSAIVCVDAPGAPGALERLAAAPTLSAWRSISTTRPPTSTGRSKC